MGGQVLEFTYRSSGKVFFQLLIAAKVCDNLDFKFPNSFSSSSEISPSENFTFNSSVTLVALVTGVTPVVNDFTSVVESDSAKLFV